MPLNNPSQDRDTQRPPVEQSAEPVLQELVYAVSHDLGASVRAVNGFADLLSRRYGDRLDDDGRNFLRLMTKGALDLQSQIEGLLMFSRVTSRGQPFTSTSMADVWQTVVTANAARLKELNAVVEQTELPLVMADEAQLTQLLSELFDNAIKFRRDEPLRLCFSAESLETKSTACITDKSPRRFWTFRLTDNGRGIAPQHHQRIFQMFQRLCPDIAGAGVGLAVCQRIVYRHGGEIWAQSESGIGTTICFTMPTTP